MVPDTDQQSIEQVNFLEISVVVCAHNPNRENLQRVIQSLRVQTLDYIRWELILVDNGSAERLSDIVDLSWHPNAQIISEERLGLIFARRVGVFASNGGIVVFVDDDNVLSPEYLGVCLEIGQEKKFLGAWGGNIVADYEGKVPEWLFRYESMLQIRAASAPRWSNVDGVAMPCGAGLAIRSEVLKYYFTEAFLDPRRQRLGYQGTNLIGGDDLDIIVSSRKLGLGWGLFPELSLKHIIPKKRTKLVYLLNLRRRHFTGMIYTSIINDQPRPAKPSMIKIATKCFLIFIRRGALASLFHFYESIGIRDAYALERS